MSGTATNLLGTKPPYRPALDGLRAVAIIGVLVFHLNPRWLPGGWFGVDLFFVLSGFLIATLLIKEQNRTGQIALVRFWLARMRRLLPALITMLVVVLLASWLWTIDARRSSVETDILAALFYVANWRFIFSDEGYFATLAMPSPVRHTWSLSIEEQFYIFFPLLMATLAVFSRKRVVHVIVITLIAVASATWMFLAYVPGSDPVRVYFGTDTRAFELLIGVIGAIALRQHSFTGFSRTITIWLEGLAWLSLTVVVASMFVVTENSAVPYRGGLVVLCLASFVAILVAASSPDTWFSRILGMTPLRWIGLISYPLYLWHWPVIIFLHSGVMGFSGVRLALFQASLSVVLAWLTYRFIEQAIRGRRPLISSSRNLSRVVMGIAAPVVIVGALIVGGTEQPFQSRMLQVPGAILTPDDYFARGHHTAMVFGNSVPASLADAVPADASPNVSLASNTDLGCDPFDGLKFSNDQEFKPSAACLAWRKTWPRQIASQEPDVLVYFVPQVLVNDVLVDGRLLKFGSSAHDRYIDDGLSTILDRSLAAGADRLALSTLACHNMMAFDREELARINDVEVVQHINKVATRWADRNDVPVIDSYTALCPNDQFSETVNGVILYKDGLHFTQESGPIYWAWMVPQLMSILKTE